VPKRTPEEVAVAAEVERAVAALPAVRAERAYAESLARGYVVDPATGERRELIDRTGGAIVDGETVRAAEIALAGPGPAASPWALGLLDPSDSAYHGRSILDRVDITSDGFRLRTAPVRVSESDAALLAELAYQAQLPEPAPRLTWLGPGPLPHAAPPARSPLQRLREFVASLVVRKTTDATRRALRRVRIRDGAEREQAQREEFVGLFWLALVAAVPALARWYAEHRETDPARHSLATIERALYRERDDRGEVDERIEADDVPPEADAPLIARLAQYEDRLRAAVPTIASRATRGRVERALALVDRGGLDLGEALAAVLLRQSKGQVSKDVKAIARALAGARAAS